jgi:hypothetical protein
MLYCKSQVGGLAMGSLTIEKRRAVARRLFAALCAHYPNRHVALVEQPGPNPTATTFVDCSMADDSAVAHNSLSEIAAGERRAPRTHLRASAESALKAQRKDFFEWSCRRKSYPWSIF